MKTRDRLLLAGTLLLFLLLPLPDLFPTLLPSPRSWSWPLLLAGSFLLFFLGGTGSPRGPRSRLWPAASPEFPWILLLVLAAFLVFRSHDREGAAEGVLAGTAALLLYRALRARPGRSGWETGCVAAASLPAGAAALADLAGWFGTGAEPGSVAEGPAWILILLPLTIRGALRSPGPARMVPFALVSLLLLVLHWRHPAPLGWPVLVLAPIAAAALSLLRRRTPHLGGSAAGVRSVAVVAGLALCGIALLNGPSLEILFADHLPLERLHHWGLTAAEIRRHPLGIGPGNLPHALAPELEPPEPGEAPLALWPAPLASDLLRFEAEIGWIFLPLLIWGAAPVLTVAAGSAAAAAGRSKLSEIALLTANLAGALSLYLFQPALSPAAIACLCLAAALARPADGAGVSGDGISPGSGPPSRIARSLALGAAALAVILAVQTAAAESFFLRGATWFRRGVLEKALRSADAALRLRGGNLRARMLRAEVLYAGGNCSGSTAEYDRLLERQPRNAKWALRQIDCFDRTGFLRDGTEVAESLARTWPRSSRIQTESARWLARTGESQEAERRLKEVLVADPLFRPAKMVLGRLLEDQGRGDEATYFYRGAARDDPEDPEPFLRLADIRFRAGRYEQSVNYYAAALRLQGDDPDLLYRAGAAVYMTGRFCRAQTLMERALELGLAPDRKAELLPRMEDLRERCRREGKRPAEGAEGLPAPRN